MLGPSPVTAQECRVEERASFNRSLPRPKAGMCRQQVETPSHPGRGRGTTCPVPKHSLLLPPVTQRKNKTWQRDTLADQLLFTVNTTLNVIERPMLGLLISHGSDQDRCPTSSGFYLKNREKRSSRPRYSRIFGK